MKHLTNEQITAACAELDIVRSNRLNNAFIANIEGRKEDADRHTAAATAMHWAIQKLMEDWTDHKKIKDYQEAIMHKPLMDIVDRMKEDGTWPFDDSATSSANPFKATASGVPNGTDITYDGGMAFVGKSHT
jgi:hypothetical protein